MQSRHRGSRAAARAPAVPFGLVSCSGTLAAIASYGASLDGSAWKASYIGVASASNRPSGFIPTISSIERMTDRKS